MNDNGGPEATIRVLKAYVEGQARLGYASFDPGPRRDDVILATYPKSGSTWTSYLLHQIRSGGDDDFTDIKNEVIDITPGHWDPGINPFELTQAWRPRTYKTHGSRALCPSGARYIYIARDPRDSFWSLYQFIHDLFGIEEKMPIETFYQEYFTERFGTGHDIGNVWDHFLDWFPRKRDGDLLWLHYEDMITDKPACLTAIARFMGVELSQESYFRVLAHSEMRHMKRIADLINPSPHNRVGEIVRGFGPRTANYARSMRFGKLRKGVAGDGRAQLPDAILAMLDRDWSARITPKLGFSSYQEMREAHRIGKFRPRW